MQSISRKLGPDIKVISGPLAIIVIVVLLTFVVFQNGYSQVKMKMAQYNESKDVEEALNAKLSVLREVRAGVLNQSDATVLALPAENPAALVVSNLRTSAAENVITLDKLSITNLNEREAIKNMNIEMDFVSQDHFSLLSYLRSIVNSAPIQTINKLEVGRLLTRGGQLEGSLALSIYWADLPTTLPQLDAPIQELSSDQQLVLAKIQNLRSPVFTTLDPQPPKERLLPFN